LTVKLHGRRNVVGAGLASVLFLCGHAVAQDMKGALPAGQRGAVAACQRSTFKIALDVGHYKAKPGAISARGITEFTYNRALAELVLTALKASGFSAAFTIGESGDPMPLLRRSHIAQEEKAALFISLHHDSAQKQYFSEWMFEGHSHPYSDKFHGYSIFVSTSSRWAKDSMTFATFLGRALEAQGLTPSLHHAEAIPGENRTLIDPELGIYGFDELAVLRGATMPALLLESGLIVNRDEEQAIQSGIYHPKVVAALVEAITRYCDHQ
jgi:N-acetylmuramoyl-L-alanine amidase